MFHSFLTYIVFVLFFVCSFVCLFIYLQVCAFYKLNSLKQVTTKKEANWNILENKQLNDRAYEKEATGIIVVEVMIDEYITTTFKHTITTY